MVLCSVSGSVCFWLGTSWYLPQEVKVYLLGAIVSVFLFSISVFCVLFSGSVSVGWDLSVLVVSFCWLGLECPSGQFLWLKFGFVFCF